MAKVNNAITPIVGVVILSILLGIVVVWIIYRKKQGVPDSAVCCPSTVATKADLDAVDCKMCAK